MNDHIFQIDFRSDGLQLVWATSYAIGYGLGLLVRVTRQTVADQRRSLLKLSPFCLARVMNQSIQVIAWIIECSNSD